MLGDRALRRARSVNGATHCLCGFAVDLGLHAEIAWSVECVGLIDVAWFDAVRYCSDRVPSRSMSVTFRAFRSYYFG